MKKILTLAVAFIVSTGFASAQRMMKVTQNNGTTTEFEVGSVAEVSFYVDETWKSLGTGLYTETILADLFALDHYVYEVEVQENVNRPGVYRIVNPYKDYPNLDYFKPYSGSYDNSQNYYLEINASNPDAVWIEYLQDSGFYVSYNYGELYIWSWAGYDINELGYTLEDEIYYFTVGSLKDGVITFPMDMIIVKLAYDYYYVNYYGDFKLVLPEAVEKVRQQKD